jgi:hypothetical protein
MGVVVDGIVVFRGEGVDDETPEGEQRSVEPQRTALARRAPGSWPVYLLQFAVLLDMAAPIFPQELEYDE